MELNLNYVHFDATQYQVIKAFEGVLHGPDLFDPNDTTRWPRGRPPNFQVRLNKSIAGGVGNDGTGTLTLHSRAFGERLRKWLREEGHNVKVLGQRIRISHSKRGVPDHIREMLDKSIYVG